MTTAPVLPIRHPRGLTSVPGNPGWAYRLDPGQIVKVTPGRDGDDKVSPVLDWCPIVSARLVTLREDGTLSGRWFRVTLGEDTGVFSYDQITTGEIWKYLETEGGSRRAVREILTDVITGQAGRLPRTIAATRTGWHAGTYVYPDGRAADAVELVGAPVYLKQAAEPVDTVPDGDVRAALAAIAEHGGWAPLFGLAVGARSLGQSFRRVPAAFVAHGDPNTGKTCTVAAGRMLLLSPSWPPVVTAQFRDTITDLECKIDFEADMPTLIDDLALTANASGGEQRDAVDKLERIIRSVGNQTPIRGRRTKDLKAQDLTYVRAIPAITAQRLPANMQASLYRRAVVIRLRDGDANWRWWMPEEKGGGGGADMAGPALRTIGDRIIAQIGKADDPGALLGEVDRLAFDALAPAVDDVMPEWRASVDGMAGVVGHAAAMLGGLVLVADAAGVDAGPLLDIVAGPLARALAEQADTIDDRRQATDDLAAAVADIIRRALMDRRAHIVDAAGDIGPGRGPEGLTANELGLRAAGRDDFGRTAWEGNGPTLYWLPAYGGLGVRSDALHDLVRANGDPRAAGYTARSLAAALHRARALVPSKEKDRETSHKVRIKGEEPTKRLLVIRPDVIWTDHAEPGGDPAGPVDAGPDVEPPAGSGPPDRVPADSPTKIISEETAGSFQDQQQEDEPWTHTSATPTRSSATNAASQPPVTATNAAASTPLPDTAEATAFALPGAGADVKAGPVPAIGADTYGLFFGDGRSREVGNAYANMPAFLTTVTDLMPDGGSVAITADVAALLGYPDKPVYDRPGRPQRRARKSPQECRAVEDGRAAGWEISDRGIGGWTIWRNGGRSVAVAVLDWLDKKTMGTSSLPCLTPEHDVMQAAYTLARYRELTGVPLVMTAGTSGTTMIRAGIENRKDRRGRQARTPLFKWDGGESPARDVQERLPRWDRPSEEWTDAERAAPYVIGWDTRTAYLAALGNANLPYDALEHAGTDDGFQDDRPGYWLVAESWQPFPLIPALTGRDGNGPAWLATPTVELLLQEGMPVEAITDAWLAPVTRGRAYAGRITRPMAQRLGAALAPFPDGPMTDPDEQHVRDLLKATYRETVGLLEHGTPFMKRNDWADTIIATCRANLYRKVIAAGRVSGRWPIRIDSDCVYYTAQTDDPARENPGLPVIGEFLNGEEIKKQPGKLKVKDTSILMADFLRKPVAK